MKQQSGFTLIELIAVIVILGILAATAVPKFVDLSDAAEDAAVTSVAGSLSSASQLNHANNLAADANLQTSSPVIDVATCQATSNLLDGGLPDGYTITEGEGTEIAGGGVASEGGSSTCELTHTGGKSANFTAYGVSST